MKTKTITEKLKEYLVPVDDDRKRFREALECNRREAHRLAEKVAEATRERTLSVGAKL